MFVDDGARTSTVSIAYRDSELDNDLVADAFPFDQGRLNDKPGIATSLFDDSIYNLPEDEWEELLDWLSRQRLVMHNAKHDLHMLKIGTRKWKGRDFQDQVVWDTMLANRILDPLEKVGLKDSAVRFSLGYDDDARKHERMVKAQVAANKMGSGRYDLVDWDTMAPYATADALWTYQLAEIQFERLNQGEGSRQLCERELGVAKCLYRMEELGIGYDVDRSRKIADQLREKLKEVGESLPFRPTVNAAKRYWFEEKIGDKKMPRCLPYEVTPKGAPRLDKDIIRRMIGDGVAYAEQWQAYVQIDKAISMWYDGWADLCGEDKRLRTNFHQLKLTDEATGKDRGAVSGRLAVQRVQIQAIPHSYQLLGSVDSVRSLFTPKKGAELWEIDLSQAEVRVASHIAKCKNMLAGLIAGDDSHAIATRQTFQIDETHPEWDFYRQVGKRLNFAMLYGAGVNKLAEQIMVFTGKRVSVEQVAEWRTAYRAQFIEFVRISKRAEMKATRANYVRLLSGMERWFQPHEERHKAFNAVIQGGVAELMKDWMIAVDRVYPGIMLVQIHDSLILEVPKGEVAIVESVARMGEQIFEAKCSRVPFIAEAKRWEDKG